MLCSHPGLLLPTGADTGSTDTQQHLCAPSFACDPDFPDEFLAQRAGVFNGGIKLFQESHRENCW